MDYDIVDFACTCKCFLTNRFHIVGVCLVIDHGWRQNDVRTKNGTKFQGNSD